MIDGYIGVGYEGPVPSNPLNPVEVRANLAAAEWVKRARPFMKTGADLISQLNCSYETLDESLAQYNDEYINDWERAHQTVESFFDWISESLSQFRENEPLAYEMQRGANFTLEQVVGDMAGILRAGVPYGAKTTVLGVCGLMNVGVKIWFVDYATLTMEEIPLLIAMGVLPPEIIDLLPPVDVDSDVDGDPDVDADPQSL